MVPPAEALPGRAQPIIIGRPHLVVGEQIDGREVRPDEEQAFFALGCFWGAERVFYRHPGVIWTAVGYQGGFTANPTYREVCTGRTGHAETVRVIFDPRRVAYADLVRLFFESHDPTQGFRQGNDVGTQYRSAIYTTDAAQESTARAVAAEYQAALRSAGYGALTTEIAAAGPFYLAEEYHQQYLEANPNGYCGLGGTGVSCPIGLSLPD